MNDNHRHASTLVNARILHRVGFGLGLGLVLIAALMYVLLRFWLAPHPAAGLRAPPAAPHLQPDPAADIAAERAQQRQRLDGYGWVDQAGGYARIPIDRAMALLVDGRGAPAVPPKDGRATR